MARAVSAEVSGFYAARHRDAGVAIHYGAAVKALHGTARVDGRRDGRRPLVPVRRRDRRHRHRAERRARGRRGACRAATASSSTSSRARPTRTSCAAGDCTNHPLPLLGRRVRLESVPNAIHQAKVAAATLLGAPVAYSEVPWFWSDQYDLKLQIAGLSTGYDEVVLRGDPATRSFAAFYLRARPAHRRRRDQQPQGVHRGEEARCQPRAHRTRRAARRRRGPHAARGLTRLTAAAATCGAGQIARCSSALGERRERDRAGSSAVIS